MRKTTHLSRFGLCLLLCGLFQPLSGKAEAQQVNRLVMATGTAGSAYFLLGGAICGQLHKGTVSPLRCAIEPSSGTVANLQALQEGKVNLALAQSDWQHHAYMGSVSQFSSEKAIKDMRALMSLTGAPLVLLARPDAAIRGVDDLAGKRLDIGKPGSGRRAAMDDLLGALGWDLGKFKLASELPEAEAIKALCGGGIDALALAEATPGRNIALALRSCSLKFVPISGETVKKLIAGKPYYSVVKVPGGGYPGVDADVPSIGLRVILLASGKVAEKDAYALVKAVATNLDAVRKLHPSLASIERAGLANAGIATPLHSGAEKYYREAKLN